MLNYTVNSSSLRPGEEQKGLFSGFQSNIQQIKFTSESNKTGSGDFIEAFQNKKNEMTSTNSCRVLQDEKETKEPSPAREESSKQTLVLAGSVPHRFCFNEPEPQQKRRFK